MRKKIWIFGIFLLAGLAGCQRQEDTQEEPVPIPEESAEDKGEDSELQEYDVKLSEKLSDFQFALNGETWELPSSLELWEEAGWSGGEDWGKIELEGESYTTEGELLKREDKTLTVYLVNPESEKKKLEECYVGGVELGGASPEWVLQLPGGITVGKSVLSEVLDVYGTPTDQYEDQEQIYVTYKYGIYKEAELAFRLEDEVLSQAVLKNYREPETEEQEISQEAPKEVAQYTAPESFSENPLDYVVSYDGAFYRIPAPVSCFTENGWKVNEEGSDEAVKPGRHGYVTLEKGGQTLYAVVKNYGEERVKIENCMVTKVSGDFDVVKVPIAVGNNISLGLSEDEVKIRLGGTTYETREEEEGTAYYLYSDETEQNYIKLFLDKDLKLLREIEVSNSPESLTEKNPKEEEERRENPDSSVLLEEEPGEE